MLRYKVTFDCTDFAGINRKGEFVINIPHPITTESEVLDLIQDKTTEVENIHNITWEVINHVDSKTRLQEQLQENIEECEQEIGINANNSVPYAMATVILYSESDTSSNGNMLFAVAQNEAVPIVDSLEVVQAFLTAGMRLFESHQRFLVDNKYIDSIPEEIQQTINDINVATQKIEALSYRDDLHLLNVNGRVVSRTLNPQKDGEIINNEEMHDDAVVGELQ